MSYETFFSLGLELDNRVVPCMCTASGTDMGAVGFATLDFSINNYPFTQQFIVCHRQTRPLILGQDFSIHKCTGCNWTLKGTKKLTVKGKLIMEVDEPEADKYFSLRKSICISPRHYAITQIQCKSLTEPITIKPDQVFKRDNPNQHGWTHISC